MNRQVKVLKFNELSADVCQENIRLLYRVQAFRVLRELGRGAVKVELFSVFVFYICDEMCSLSFYSSSFPS